MNNCLPKHFTVKNEEAVTATGLWLRVAEDSQESKLKGDFEKRSSKSKLALS